MSCYILKIIEMRTFGEYIKHRRNELGFPLMKIADSLKIDTSTLGKIEKEERKKNVLFVR